MAFDALFVKALEGFNKFYKYDRPSINWRIINMAWAGKRDWGKTEMTKFKRHQQPHLAKVTFYSCSNL